MKLEGADTLGVLPAGSVCQLGVFAMCFASRQPAAAARLGLCSDVECSAELNNKIFEAFYCDFIERNLLISEGYH